MLLQLSFNGLLYFLNQGLTIFFFFFLMSQVVNILGFVSQFISFTTIQLFCWVHKSNTDYK